MKIINIIIIHNEKVIVDKDIDVSLNTGVGAQLILDIFEHWLGIDIKSYRLSEIRVNQDKPEIILYIRDSDLQLLRDNKINKILQ